MIRVRGNNLTGVAEELSQWFDTNIGSMNQGASAEILG